MFISGFADLLHSFNRVVSSCNFWFKSFGQTVAQLYMYVCLNTVCNYIILNKRTCIYIYIVCVRMCTNVKHEYT